MLRSVHRAVQSGRRCQTSSVQARISQDLRRSLAFRASNLPDVQNGHSQTLRLRGN